MIVLSPNSCIIDAEIITWSHPKVFENWVQKLPNWAMQSNHAQPLQFLYKWNDLGLFGKLAWKGTNLMLERFPFGAWTMINFGVKVGGIKYTWKFSKLKVKWPLFPYWINFSIRFKWLWLLLKSCIYFNYIQFGHKFDTIWILHDGDMDFRSWGKMHVQW